MGVITQPVMRVLVRGLAGQPTRAKQASESCSLTAMSTSVNTHSGITRQCERRHSLTSAQSAAAHSAETGRLVRLPSTSKTGWK